MKKILIIDDNEDIRNFLSVALQAYYPDLEILEAEDGQDGLQKATEWQPDLIFVDGQMPKLSGDIVSQQIRSNPDLQGTRIVGFTAAPTHSDLTENMSHFCDVLLAKTSPLAQIIQACTA
jgi:CheY-like chemotaxis protein